MARINKNTTKDNLESVINTRGKMIIVSEAKPEVGYKGVGFQTNKQCIYMTFFN